MFGSDHNIDYHTGLSHPCVTGVEMGPSPVGLTVFTYECSRQFTGHSRHFTGFSVLVCGCQRLPFMPQNCVRGGINVTPCVASVAPGTAGISVARRVDLPDCSISDVDVEISPS